jgi:hypothetical protein
MTKDAAFEEYLEAVESHLSRLRGRSVSLAGHDFDQARSLHRAGIPLANVLTAIDRAAEAAGPVVSLGFCERFLPRRGGR